MFAIQTVRDAMYVGRISGHASDQRAHRHLEDFRMLAAILLIADAAIDSKRARDAASF